MRNHFVQHSKLFLGFQDDSGLLQRDKISAFASAKWNMGHNDRGFKGWMANQYYNACNAYDSRYEGISCQDFVECNLIFDWIAMERIMPGGMK